MPSLMLTYRAAAFWQRMYCPEISMGFLTKEEADDISYADYEEVKPDEPKPNKKKLTALASQAAGISNKPEPAPEPVTAKPASEPTAKPQMASLL